MEEQRRAVVWEAQHENRWKTVVAQRQGSFVAYTALGKVAKLAYSGDSFQEACESVLASLARATGHDHCSSRCSEWVVRLSRPGELIPSQ